MARLDDHAKRLFGAAHAGVSEKEGGQGSMAQCSSPNE